jgi:hypothetical protein
LRTIAHGFDQGGFKAYADNVRVLQANNEQYATLLEQQRLHNMRLEKDLQQFSGSLQDLTQQVRPHALTVPAAALPSMCHSGLPYVLRSLAHACAIISTLLIISAIAGGQNTQLQGTVTTLERTRDSLRSSVHTLSAASTLSVDAEVGCWCSQGLNHYLAGHRT